MKLTVRYDNLNTGVFYSFGELFRWHKEMGITELPAGVTVTESITGTVHDLEIGPQGALRLTLRENKAK